MNYNDCNPDCATAANGGPATVRVEVVIPVSQLQACPGGDQYMALAVKAVDSSGAAIVGSHGMSYKSPGCGQPLGYTATDYSGD